ncbi:MAG: DEAD/DEAH box helicase [Actinomycetota bacterium]|nr:DEAD/DEAH box helicase [Actinomycetota bacterium]MDH5224391.1 DEAD/DEAH box helicase [Actinomycetota bacterium]MDH5314040.1 DEAD/DEAH box helicase [Actinomycetota bacterium]
MTGSTRSFRDLGVTDAVIDTLAARGIEEPFPIQVMVLEDATAGRDTLARSKTGSGKTLGFAIPIVEQLDPDSRSRPEALVLVPTRELATQVRDDFADIAKAKHLKVKAVYGGTNVSEQSKGVSDVHILIATPGRLDDLAQRKMVRLDGVRIFVLDEADRMLDMGFQPQVDRIVRRLPKDRQTMFFSATLDGAVGRIAEVYTRNPVRHEIEFEGKTVEEADHRFVPIESHEKLAGLIELAKDEEPDGLTLVFVNTKRAVDALARQLRAQGVPAVTMHGDMTQQARERALQRFEEKHVGVLIATDVAARGLDLDDITLVVNYDPPQDDKGYVHRVGRTARAGKTGTSVTFVTPEQLGDVSRMAARLDLHAEFELEGMKVAPPRTVFSGSARGRRSGLKSPKRRR